MSFKKVILFFITTLVFLTVACTAATKSNYKQNSNVVDREYKIGKGDVLEVNVWKEESLTRTVTVRQDGMISLPLIDDVRASGLTPLELKKLLQNKIGEYIESPTVTVIVQSTSSKRFYVMGQVVNPGEYQLSKDLTVLQAISQAGGFTEWADKANILLIRNNEDGKEHIKVNYHKVVSGRNLGQDVKIKSNDMVVVR